MCVSVQTTYAKGLYVHSGKFKQEKEKISLFLPLIEYVDVNLNGKMIDIYIGYISGSQRYILFLRKFVCIFAEISRINNLITNLLTKLESRPQH